MPSPNLRLTVDTLALAANWHWLAGRSGAAACGAAVKADAYGLGARAVVAALARVGCREFFVASWGEAAALGPLPAGVRLAVLHGVQDGEMATALASPAVPVLSTAAQVARWRSAAPGRDCDIMVDTGMNRLGLSVAEALSGLLDGLRIDTLHSHLACAEMLGHPLNARQLAAFSAVIAAVPAKRAALAASAGILLGLDYAFGLTRPGLALYGGVPCAAAAGQIAPVVRLEARVIQVRDVPAGASVGYGATWIAARDSRIAVVNLGYGDGYPRALMASGTVRASGVVCPLAGRVSMDVLSVDATAADVIEGDWLEVAFDVADAAAAAGVSQYELLTGLGRRYQRVYS